MADWLELYSNAVVNAEIAASATEIFGSEEGDKQNRSKFGSFNFLTLTSSSSEGISLKLDGQQVFARLNGSGAVIIEAKDGKFFNYFEITNNGASAVTASDINIRYGVAIEKLKLKDTKQAATREVLRQKKLRNELR